MARKLKEREPRQTVLPGLGIEAVRGYERKPHEVKGHRVKGYTRKVPERIEPFRKISDFAKRYLGAVMRNPVRLTW